MMHLLPLETIPRVMAHFLKKLHANKGSFFMKENMGKLPLFLKSILFDVTPILNYSPNLGFSQNHSILPAFPENVKTFCPVGISKV